MRRVARETALPEVNFDIVPAALGDEAPLWGAVALAQEELKLAIAKRCCVSEAKCVSTLAQIAR